jgi:hypothetical protein
MFLGFVWRPVLVATEEWVRLDRKKQGEGVEWEWYGAMAVEPKLSIGAKLSTVLLWSGTLRQPDSVAHQEKHERNLWFILYTTEWLLSKTGGQEWMQHSCKGSPFICLIYGYTAHVKWPAATPHVSYSYTGQPAGPRKWLVIMARESDR